MRQVLVDHARAKTTDKRGGGVRPASLSGGGDGGDGGPAVRLRADPLEVIALSDALVGLDADDPEAATLVKMRAFGGMDPDEIAALLGVGRRTFERRWRVAMADLRARMVGGDG